MEKVKITKEQKEALVQINVNQGKFAFEKFLLADSYDDNYKKFAKLTPEEFSLVLCGWYEVEGEFKVGDWIKSENRNMYAKVVKIESDRIWYQFAGEEVEVWSFKRYAYPCFNKVTEQWKITLLDLGRERPELRMGDMYIDDVNDNWMIDSEQFLEDYALPDFESGKVKIFFPIEKGIEIKAR